MVAISCNIQCWNRHPSNRSSLGDYYPRVDYWSHGAVLTYGVSDDRLQLTPLRGYMIGAILRARISYNDIPI